MAQATQHHNRFHNLSHEALADAIGQADAVLKGAEAETRELKDEFKRRGLTDVAGEHLTVTATEQIAGRLDVNAVKQYLGDSWRRFEVPAISTVVRIRAVQRFAHAAQSLSGVDEVGHRQSTALMSVRQMLVVRLLSDRSPRPRAARSVRDNGSSPTSNLRVSTPHPDFQKAAKASMASSDLGARCVNRRTPRWSVLSSCLCMQ
jgi:hypothetical protein